MKHNKNNETSPAPVARPADWGEMVERWLSEWPRPPVWSDLRRTMGSFDLMKVEEFTEGDQVVVRAEMPGIDPDKDVHITVNDHTLRVQAERREEKSSDEDGTYRSEFNYGSFARTVTLPAGASDKDVKATYKDGILEVRIPIDRREAAAKQVPVHRV